MVTQVKAIDLPVESVQIRMLLLIEDEVVRQWAGELSAYNSVIRAGDNKTELEAVKLPGTVTTTCRMPAATPRSR